MIGPRPRKSRKDFSFFLFFVLPEQLNSVLKMENKSSLMATISLNRLNLRYSSFLREYSRFLQRSLKFSYLHHADLYSIEVIFFVFFFVLIIYRKFNPRSARRWGMLPVKIDCLFLYKDDN